jgi:uncharacterized RDD family membrane protein YckC
VEDIVTRNVSQWTLPPEQTAPVARYANLAERVLATLVDYVVVVLIGGIPYAAIGAGSLNAGPVLRNVGALLILVVYFAVYGWTAAFWNGQTIGGRLLRIRIVRRSDHGPIRDWQAAIRPIGLILTVLLWFISLFTVLLGREKRTPSDLLTRTVVMKGLPWPPIQPPT